MRRRILRGCSWGLVVGVGLALGLMLGGRIQGIAVDGSMALALAAGAAVLGFVAGAALPVRPPSTDDPVSIDDPVAIDVADGRVAAAPAIDLSTSARAVVDVTAPPRRERPLRPRTPSE